MVAKRAIKDFSRETFHVPRSTWCSGHATRVPGTSCVEWTLPVDEFMSKSGNVRLGMKSITRRVSCPRSMHRETVVGKASQLSDGRAGRVFFPTSCWDPCRL